MQRNLETIYWCFVVGIGLPITFRLEFWNVESSSLGNFPFSSKSLLLPKTLLLLSQSFFLAFEYSVITLRELSQFCCHFSYNSQRIIYKKYISLYENVQ